MKKFIFRSLVFILILSGLFGYGFVSHVNSAPSCTIATHSVTVGNGTLFYNQVGIGRTILLLHGLFADKKQWEGMMCRLSQEGYRAIAVDLPGYGNSTGFTVRDYVLENQVILIHEFMERLKIDSFDLAGSSMGGAIATLYTQRYPEQVLSLALIGSPLGVIGWANSVKESIFEGVNPFIPITKKQFDLEMSLLFVKPPSIPDSVKTEKVNDYITRNRHYQQIWDIVNLYDDVFCQKPLIRLPTLVIWGKEDKIYDLRGVEQLQNCISSSKIIQLSKAGHLLLMENAADAASEYISFLRITNKRATYKVGLLNKTARQQKQS